MNFKRSSRMYFTIKHIAIQGKKEFACAFLDKMYVMSSADAMSSFVKNPRPYLLPPCPQIPCKIAVVGQPFTGKTDLVHDLAKELGVSWNTLKLIIFQKKSLIFINSFVSSAYCNFLLLFLL